MSHSRGTFIKRRGGKSTWCQLAGLQSKSTDKLSTAEYCQAGDMQQMHQRPGGRRADHGGDRIAENRFQGASKLQQEAGGLLCERSSMAAFQSRMSPAGPSIEEAAHNVRDSESLKANNVNTDQIQMMLDANPCAALFDGLLSNDRDAALRFAESNSLVQTHALHCGDKAFSERLRLSLTGSP